MFSWVNKGWYSVVPVWIEGTEIRGGKLKKKFRHDDDKALMAVLMCITSMGEAVLRDGRYDGERRSC